MAVSSDRQDMDSTGGQQPNLLLADISCILRYILLGIPVADGVMIGEVCGCDLQVLAGVLDK